MIPLTVTISSDEAKRILNLAWKGARGVQENGRAAPTDKRLLESFRAECESANGSRL